MLVFDDRFVDEHALIQPPANLLELVIAPQRTVCGMIYIAKPLEILPA
jgi:hypothetical protein